MPKKSKAVVIALSLVVLSGAAVFLSCSNQENFTGSRGFDLFCCDHAGHGESDGK